MSLLLFLFLGLAYGYKPRGGFGFGVGCNIIFGDIGIGNRTFLGTWLDAGFKVA